MLNYQPKYNRYELKYPLYDRPKWVNGSKPNPELYTEHALLERDIHYALLKHRAQARFRGESHSLTTEEWQELWTVERWMQRGRTVDSLCLSMIDPSEGWHLDNVSITTRREHLKRNKEYRAKNK